MKKYFVLLIIVSFLAGCATLSQKYTEPGRHYWNIQNPVVEAEQDLEKIARQYRITEPIKLAIVGSDQMVVADAKEVFIEFGFRVVKPDYDGYVNYIIEVQRIDQAQEVSGTYLIGYSVRQKTIVKAVMFFDDESGVEHRFDGIQEFSTRQYYSGYYHQKQTGYRDPGSVAFRAALMEAIGEFIDGESIPHYWPAEK